MASVGEQICKLRKDRGWTQEILAEKLGVTKRLISRWETESNQPSARMLRRVAELFGTELDGLLERRSGGHSESELPSMDQDLAERFRKLQTLNASDRALALRIIDMIITQRQMQDLLSSQQAS